MPESNEKNWFEWGIFAASCILIAIVVGFLSWEAFTYGNEPADIRISIDDLAYDNQTSHARLTAKNIGGSSATNVQIEVRAPGGEISQLAFEFIPRGASARGTVIFSGIISKSDLTPRVLGYEED